MDGQPVFLPLLIGLFPIPGADDRWQSYQVDHGTAIGFTEVVASLIQLPVVMLKYFSDFSINYRRGVRREQR